MGVLYQDEEQTMELQESLGVVQSFPYFVLRANMDAGYNDYIREVALINHYYGVYKRGAKFVPEGAHGDYIPATLRSKKAKELIDREARFMFSQEPDINIIGLNEDSDKEQLDIYKTILEAVKDKNGFSRRLLQAAKDCFIGKRAAILVDYSETAGVLLHFYNSMQFYYELEYGTEDLQKFISFERVGQLCSNLADMRYYVNRYEKVNGHVYMDSVVYDGAGKQIEQLIPWGEIELDYIPAFIIINDGILEEKRGTSDIAEIEAGESVYNKVANADIDADRKGMNSIKYVVDMNSRTTKDLSFAAGSFWELKSEQNQNYVTPQVGELSSALNHTDAVKTTLERIENSLHSTLDVPNINSETIKGIITSGKALRALYYPLTVRCNEKIRQWEKALQGMVNATIDLCLLNSASASAFYVVSEIKPVQYKVEIVGNYALLDDEAEEKDIDLAEITANTRSRKSYIKKWRKDEFNTDADIDAELMQIAVEINMFDSLSANMNVQNEIDRQTVQNSIDSDIDTQAALDDLSNSTTQGEESTIDNSATQTEG